MVLNRRQIPVLIFSITLILVVIHPLNAAPPLQLGGQVDLRIEPGTGEGISGQQVMVEVIAEKAAAMAGLQLEVVYDSAVAQAVSVEPGTLPTGTFFQGNANAGTSPATIVIASASPFGAANETVTLAKITFDLVGDSGEMTDLVLDGVRVSDSAVRPLPFTTANAKITITDALAYQPSFILHQDPVDGATGVEIDIAWRGEQANGQDQNVLLGSFQVQITYGGSCLHILGVRGMDFTVSDVSINNIVGVTTFNGSSPTGVAAPAALGHLLTRLVGGARQPCSMTLETVDLQDVDGNTTELDQGSLRLEMLRGDARADGVVNIADALFIAQYLVDSRQACTSVVDTTCLHAVNAASVAQDEAFDKNTIADTLLIAQYLLGPRDEFYNSVPSADGNFTYEIDEHVVPSRASLPGIKGGPPRPVGAIVDSTGKSDEFVINEVIFRPRDDGDLNTFLTKYDGVILHDGTPTIIPGARTPPGLNPEPSGSYLIHVNLNRSSLDDLSSNMEAAGLRGHFGFSSEDSARLASLLGREIMLRSLGPNILLTGDTLEHPDGVGGNLNTETWWWMTEDDDPSVPGDQGLSVGTIHAWEYLRYLNVPPQNGIWNPPVVAIIDGGFDLDQVTGAPLNDNVDYFYLGSRPLQADFVDFDGTAGGMNLMSCGGSPCPWHGQGAFGVCCSRPSNGFGSAGSGGPVARPMLLKVDSSLYSVAGAIRSAAINGADVISLSLSGGCAVWTWICSLPPDDIYTTMNQEVSFANSWGSVVVAAAGNNGIDLADDDFIPCESEGVICVGAITSDQTVCSISGAPSPAGMAASYSNYGSGVDIWAPTGILSTVSPLSSAADSDDIGCDELYYFTGTSASTPFVAGIIALMKAIDPTLYWSEILAILQDTANPGLVDSKVTPGYVDAYRAATQVRPNEPPTVVIKVLFLLAESNLSYTQSINLSSEVVDPEVGMEFKQFGGVVDYYSDLDGPLCSTSGTSTGLFCLGPELSLGTHVISAVAIDGFGATGMDSMTINVINRPPTANIISPTTGSTYFTDQVISFNGSAYDPDEETIDLDREWRSDRDGIIGTGEHITASLSQGTHVITLTPTDGLGLSGKPASINLTILAGTGLPSANFIPPLPPNTASPGESITFHGSGSDPEDGVIPSSSLSWFSDIDGFLGTGDIISVVLSGPPTPCKPETILHRITMEVTDSDGNKATDQRGIIIGVIC